VISDCSPQFVALFIKELCSLVHEGALLPTRN
jgi:hypothetical protein